MCNESFDSERNKKMQTQKEIEIELAELFARICTPADSADAARRWDMLAKPLKSMGIAENDLIRIAGIQAKDHAVLTPARAYIFCADNGIVEESVTQTGQDVTAIVAKNISEGKASASILSHSCGIELIPVDVGMVQDVDIRTMKSAYGTKNFRKESAMSKAELLQAMKTGIRLAAECKKDGICIAIAGEMSIGNTTTSAAVASALLNRSPKEITGRGAGLDDAGLQNKIQVIQAGLNRIASKPEPERFEAFTDSQAEVFHILMEVGGFDLVAMTGFYLGTAAYHIPVILDGMISQTAALCAAKIVPMAAEYWIPSHCSNEPVSALLLEQLGMHAVINASLKAGEGCGAILYYSLLTLTNRIFYELPSFEEVNIIPYQDFEEDTKRTPERSFV